MFRAAGGKDYRSLPPAARKPDSRHPLPNQESLAEPPRSWPQPWSREERFQLQRSPAALEAEPHDVHPVPAEA